MTKPAKKPNNQQGNKSAPNVNPIWDTAAKIQTTNEDQKRKDLVNKVEAAFKTHTAIPEKPNKTVIPQTNRTHVEQNSTESAVMQPGETHTL